MFMCIRYLFMLLEVDIYLSAFKKSVAIGAVICSKKWENFVLNFHLMEISSLFTEIFLFICKNLKSVDCIF